MFTLILPKFLPTFHTTLPAIHSPSLNQILRFSRFQAAYKTTADLYYHYLVHPLDTSSNHAYATPISQQLGMNTTLLLDSHSFSISKHEADCFIKDLNTFYQPNAHFSIITPELWQLTLPHIDNWSMIEPIWNVGGQMDSLLRCESHASKQWLQLNTEIQMWLHQHPINQHRQQQGLLPINSLWLWQAKQVLNTLPDYQLIASDSLWKSYCHIQHTDLPNHFAEWQHFCDCQQQDINQTALFAEDFIACHHQSHIWTYQQIIEQWEQRYFLPIWQAIQSRKIQGLKLVCEQGIFTLSPYARYHFWKPKNSINQIIQTLIVD